MRKSIIRIKGLGAVVWHVKHDLVHVLWGLVWIYILGDIWRGFTGKWIVTTAIFGSLIPDIDHFIYFFTYGKKDPYTKVMFTFLKGRQWRVLLTFLENNHKNNTNLSFHNYYTIAVLVSLCAFSYMYGWKFGVVLFGAMVIHFLYDIFDDLLYLGKVNPNWKRWGRAKRRTLTPAKEPSK